MTNLIAVIALARVLSTDEFGVFSLVYTGLTLFLGVSRAFFGIPLAMAAWEGEVAIRKLYTRSISALLILTLPIVAAIIGLGIVTIGQPMATSSLLLVGVVAVATPLVLMQDAARYYAISTGRQAVAVLSDSVWFAGVTVLMFLGSEIDSTALALAWLGTIVVAFLIALLALPPSVDFSGALRLMVPKRGVRESVAGLMLLSSSVSLLVALMVSPIFGVQAVGSLRGAGTLFGPINTLIAFLDLAVLGSLMKRSRARDARALALVLGAMIAMTISWAVCLLVLPSQWGAVLLGETWQGARSLIPATAAEYVLLAAGASMALVLKARSLAGVLIRNKVLSSAVILVAVGATILLTHELIWVALSLGLGALAGASAMAVSLARTLRNDNVQ